MEVLSANSSPGRVGGRKSSDSSSPEFEFWMVRNPSFPQTHLLSADELFVDGFILPLHLLPNPSDLTSSEYSNSEPSPEQEPEREHTPSASSSPYSAPATSSSRRWTDIFKVVGEKKGGERRKERRNSAGGTAELNINIWPFSRSRSAGNSSLTKLKVPATAAVSGRKVSSEPCSRSNSQGESSRSLGAKKWTSSPGRSGLSTAGGGVPVGRASPVWQVRRYGKKWPEPEEGAGDGGSGNSDSNSNSNSSGANKKGIGGSIAGVSVLNLNVNSGIGDHKDGLTRGDHKDELTNSDRSQGRAATGTGSSHFNLRTLFSKKVY